MYEFFYIFLGKWENLKRKKNEKNQASHKEGNRIFTFQDIPLIRFWINVCDAWIKLGVCTHGNGFQLIETLTTSTMDQLNLITPFWVLTIKWFRLVNPYVKQPVYGLLG